MNNLTGSIESERYNPLTPFEQAEHNLLQFANNAAFGQKLHEVVERLKYLETLQKISGIEEKLGTTDHKDETFSKSLQEELKAVELVLELLFDVHENLPEA